MTREEIFAFISGHRWAVEATICPTGSPQAAVVGFVATEELELFFDTLKTSRKYKNLEATPKIALVIGWDNDCTLQYEGIADKPTGTELERLKSRYFKTFPEGLQRSSWEALAYIRVKPIWMRFSDFRATPPRIVELQAAKD